jgi:hypothetical protein
MPGVLNRYLKFEAAGDFYVGHCVSGQGRFGQRFAESNPYFDFSKFSDIEKLAMHNELAQWIKDRMPSAARRHTRVF